MARQCGISAYLTKPVRRSDLYASLITVIGYGSEFESKELVTQHSIAEDLGRDNSRILVVEDNPINQEVAIGMLRKFGCQVESASNGREAVDAIFQKSYDLVFMDCQMPVLDGYQATAEIRRQEKERGVMERTPIVALTANAMEGDSEKCLAAGMDGYLSKPFRQKDMLEILKHWLNGNQSNIAREETAGKRNIQRKESIVKSEKSCSEKDTHISPIDRRTLRSIQDLQIEGEPSAEGAGEDLGSHRPCERGAGARGFADHSRSSRPRRWHRWAPRHLAEPMGTSQAWWGKYRPRW